MIIATFLLCPAASGVVAKPPPMAELLAAESPTAAEPLSLLPQLRFKGLARTVTDPDMMIERGLLLEPGCKLLAIGDKKVSCLLLAEGGGGGGGGEGVTAIVYSGGMEV